MNSEKLHPKLFHPLAEKPNPASDDFASWRKERKKEKERFR